MKNKKKVQKELIMVSGDKLELHIFQFKDNETHYIKKEQNVVTGKSILLEHHKVTCDSKDTFSREVGASLVIMKSRLFNRGLGWSKFKKFLDDDTKTSRVLP